MKIQYLIIILILLIISCNQNKSNTFNSKKLKGSYKVDLSPVINEFNKKDSKDEFADFATNLASFAFSSIDMKISFYDKNKGIIEINGGLIDFAQAFGDEPIERVNDFSYKVKNDSIIFIKDNESGDFEKLGVLRKFTENYDYLKLIVNDKEDEDYVIQVNLIKIKE